MASSPRIIRRIAMSDTQLRRESPISRFIVPPRAQASRRCENTSVARRQAAKLRYRFGPLTPSARSGSLIAGDGTKNGLSRSEQKNVSTNQHNRLTGKAPYKFESSPLQRGVTCELVPASVAPVPCGADDRPWWAFPAPDTPRLAERV